MAIKKSNVTTGMARMQLPSPVAAYAPATMILTHVFSEAVATADILELAVLPPYCRVISAELIGEGTGATTFTVGLMSGEFGSTDPARTSGNELFSAVAGNALQTASLVSLAALGKTDTARSIGVRASAAIAANPATKLHLRISYATGF